MAGLFDYNAAMGLLSSLVKPVADDPFSRRDAVNPLMGLEGAGGPRQGGGGGRTIVTDKGEKIRLTEEPRWNDFHKRYYAYGNRMVKSRGTFSGVTGLHNFKGFSFDD
jgi:hypothetical protein